MWPEKKEAGWSLTAVGTMSEQQERLNDILQAVPWDLGKEIWEVSWSSILKPSKYL